MLKLVTYLINNLVDNPDQVTIKETTDDTGLTTISVLVAPDDMGKVIGRGGKVISAVRELTKIKAIKAGKRVRVVVKEPEETIPPIPEPQSVEPQPTPSQPADEETDFVSRSELQAEPDDQPQN